MKQPMNILVGCESSGTVRDAFNRLGHNATSCDLLPSEVGGNHYTGDLLDILYSQKWDLVIAHPPCTYLTVSAAWAFQDPDFEKYPESGYHQKVKPNTLTGQDRREAREKALLFVKAIMDAPCDKIAIENPVGAISKRLGKATQYIQPYEFGHDASKKTGLWLKNLPKLVPTQYVLPRITDDGKERWGNQTDSGQNRLTPSENRWQVRSKTYQGVASAMATQWGMVV